MAFTKLTKSVLNITALPDRVENQAQVLKATFDQAGVDIKEAHNALIDELELNSSASNIGARNTQMGNSTVQTELDLLNTKLANKVDKTSGKQLSTEDYTTEEKTKLAGITEGANNYVLPEASTTTLGGIKVDGSTIVVENGVAKAKTADSADYTARAEIEELKNETEVKVSELQTSINDIAPLIGNVETSVNKMEGDLYTQDRYNLLRVTSEETKKVDINRFVQKSTVGHNVKAVATDGNGLYVAVGTGGYIATSTDLINWTQRTSGSSLDFNDIAYGDGVFIAVGGKQRIYKSADGGVTWALKYEGSAGGSWHSHSIAYGNGGFMVGGTAQDTLNENNLYFSTDGGETWGGRDVGTGTTVLYISFANNQFVLTSYDGSTIYTAPTADSSLTTIATGITVFNNYYVYNIIYANDYYVAGGYHNLAISKDLRTWTKMFDGRVNSLMEDEGQIIIGLDSGYLKATEDFGNIQQSSSTYGAVIDLLKEGDKITLFTSDGSVYESTTYLSEYKQYLDIPLTSYEKGKIINVEGGKLFEPKDLETVAENLFPASSDFTSNSATKYTSSEGFVLTSSGGQEYLLKAIDDSVSTDWQDTTSNLTTQWIRMEIPNPNGYKITKMKLKAGWTGQSSQKIAIEGSFDGNTWTDLFVWTGLGITVDKDNIKLNNPDFYKYYRVSVVLNSGVGARAVIYDWKVSEYLKVLSVEEQYVTSFYNPMLNINNLGEKQINAIINYGEKYSLVYNGESWDVLKQPVLGSFAVSTRGSTEIDLDGVKFVLFDVSTYAQPDYSIGPKIVGRGQTSYTVYSSSSNYITGTLSGDGQKFTVNHQLADANTINYVAFY